MAMMVNSDAIIPVIHKLARKYNVIMYHWLTMIDFV